MGTQRVKPARTKCPPGASGRLLRDSARTAALQTSGRAQKAVQSEWASGGRTAATTQATTQEPYAFAIYLQCTSISTTGA